MLPGASTWDPDSTEGETASAVFQPSPAATSTWSKHPCHGHRRHYNTRHCHRPHHHCHYLFRHHHHYNCHLHYLLPIWSMCESIYRLQIGSSKVWIDLENCPRKELVARLETNLRQQVSHPPAATWFATCAPILIPIAPPPWPPNPTPSKSAKWN